MSAKTKDRDRPSVLIADDNPEMRNTVAQMVAAEFDVVGSVTDGLALVEAESRLHPNIGIVDISMPVMSGIEAVLEIKRRGSAMKIVFLTVNEDTDFVTAALETGATGYVVKRRMALDLVHALRETSKGRCFISSCCRIPEKR